MTDWTQIDKVVIFEGNDENGNRYLNQFLKDYAEIFGSKNINAGCSRCLNDYWERFTKHFSTMSKVKNSGYKLKPKFEGIALEFGSQIHVTNANLSDEYAEKLIKNHKIGEQLFEEFPSEDAVTKSDTLKTLKKLGREELDARASALGLDPKSYPNKTSIAEAISQTEETEPAQSKKGSQEEE